MSKHLCLLRRPAEISAFQTNGTRPDCDTHIHITRARAGELAAKGEVRIDGDVAMADLTEMGLPRETRLVQRVFRPDRIFSGDLVIGRLEMYSS